MTRALAWTAIVAATVTGNAAVAQEFKGAEVSAEVLGYTDNSDLGETAYRGSLEFGIFGPFGIQADLAFHDSRTVDLGARTTTVHVTYDALAFATVGLFYSHDELDESAIDGSVSLYGLEAGRNFGAAAGEAYFGFFDSDGDNGQVAGAEGSYDISRNISVTGSADILFSDADATRFALGGAYRFGDGGPSVFGQVGRLNVDGDGDTFLTLGAKLAIGPSRGTTFGSRGLFDILSGF